MEKVFRVKLQQIVYLLNCWLELAWTYGPASLGTCWLMEVFPSQHSADQR